MKLTISDSPQFYFGRLRSSQQRFEDEAAAIHEAKELAAVDDESVDVFHRPTKLSRWKVFCRVHPNGDVEFF